MTLESLEVLLLQPDFASSPKLVGSQKTDSAEMGEAARIQSYPGDHPLHSFTHRFNLTNRQDIATLEDFLYDRAGRWQPFWLPSWHGELSPVASILNGESQLSITPVNYATVYDPTTTNRARIGHYIFLLNFAGDFLIRRVTAVSGSSPEVLTLDSPVTSDFTLGRFAVGFVYCVSLLSDKLIFNFNGRDNATIELAVTEEAFIDEAVSEPETPTIPTNLRAKFSSDFWAGDPPLEVDLTDLSEGTPTSWLWDFGDGSAPSTTQNPTHTFTLAGSYIVKLTVRDANGNSSFIRHGIHVNNPAVPPGEFLQADFTLTPTSGEAALLVSFTDTSTGTPNRWNWSLGDGTYSSEQNPVHTYDAPGVYTITLMVLDTTGAISSVVKSLTVTEAGPPSVACDSGASYEFGDYYIGSSCAGCCTTLDAMAIDELAIWSNVALENCLGLVLTAGQPFEFNGKTYWTAYDYSLNTPGSMFVAGIFFYDVVRTA